MSVPQTRMIVSTKGKLMEITISVKVLKELIAIADDYLKDEHASDLGKSYFIGKRDAYKNILTTYTNEEWDNN
jgi:hypothetical protein